MNATLPKRQGSRARRLKALIVKESYQVVRDPSSILIAFVLPMILLFLFGYGLSLDSNRIPVGLISEDLSASAASLSRAFFSTRYFDAHTYENRAALDTALTAGRIRGFIIIPEHFGRRLRERGLAAPVQVITDGSEPNTATFVQNYAQAVLANWLGQQGLEQARRAQARVALEPRVWYNPELESRRFLVPGSLSIIMALIGTLLTALVVAREWERGTMEALMATPIGIGEIIVGKLVPYFVLGLLSMGFCTFVAITLFGLPFRGSPILLTVVSALFLLAALGQGLLISTAARNQFVAAQAAIVSGFLPAVMLSGFVYEISSAPAPIRFISRLLPARYLVSSLQTLFLAGDVYPVLLHDMAFLALIAAFFFFVTARKTVKRLD